MSLIDVKKEGRISTITLSTENPFNPISPEMLEEILTVIDEEDNVVLIHGRNKAFSAGADISRFPSMSPSEAYHFSQKGHEIMNRIATRNMPVLSAIHGFALGGGLELSLACDIRICHPSTVFGLPEITLGILPGFGGTQRLKALVGEGRAFNLISRGERFTSEQALNWGVVTEVCENYFERGMEIAKKYEQLPYESLSYIKKLLRPVQVEMLDLEMEYFANLFSTDNKTEGVKAFLEKRKPVFNKNIYRKKL